MDSRGICSVPVSWESASATLQHQGLQGRAGAEHGIKSRLTDSGAYPIALGQRVVECACPGQADMGTTVGVAVDTPWKSAKQHSTKNVGRTLRRAQKSYLKKRTSAVSSVARIASSVAHIASRGSAVSSVAHGAARSWTTPSASSGTRTPPPLCTRQGRGLRLLHPLALALLHSLCRRLQQGLGVHPLHRHPR